VTTSAVTPAIAFTGSSGAGTLGPFSLIKGGTPIYFADNSYIKVLRYSTVSDAVPDLLVEGVDYDLTGGPDAGSLLLTTPQTGLLDTERLFVYREQVLQQLLSLSTGGNFSGPAIMVKLDRAMEMVAETRRLVDTSVRFTPFSTDSLPDNLPMEAVLDKIVYISGTASEPVYETINATDIAGDLGIIADNIVNVNLVGTDLGGADTIGIVAADLAGDDSIGTVAVNIADVNTVANSIDAGDLTTIVAGLDTKLTVGTYAEMQAVSLANAATLNGFIITDRGASTLYTWQSGDQSVNIDGGFYVAPTADATGASGAWAASVTDITPMLYGAVGDGSTDDTTAIQAAITAANATTNKRLYFPAGTYKITAQLIIHSGATWHGDGLDRTIIQVDSSAGNIVPFRTNTTSNIATAQSVTSITSSTTTATVTTSVAHGYTTGDLINILGATETEYLGSYAITVTGASTFTYQFAGSATSPATGTITCVARAYLQTGVAFYDLHIKGFDDVLTVTESAAHSTMMRLWSIDGLTIERCKFSGHRFIMLSLGGVTNFSIKDCEFEDWGRTDDLRPLPDGSGTLPANEAGAAIWCAGNPVDSAPSTLGEISGNWFHDGEWSCIYLLGQHMIFSGNRMENFKEGNFLSSTSIFATVLPSTSESYGIIYTNNIHIGVTERLTQASGLECGGVNVVVSNNYFENCDGAAIDFTDASENCVAIGNICINCATSAYSANYASIVCRLTSVTAKACNGITISGNVIRSADDGQYGIRLYRVSGGGGGGPDEFNNIRIVNNDVVDAASSSVNNIAYDTTYFGTNIVIKDNSGASDYAVSATWTPTISASSGALSTTSTPTARYWADGPNVYFTITITLTDIGTGSGSLRFTLPTTPAYSGSCVGTNTANAKIVHGSWSTTTTVNCYYYDGTFPALSTHTIRISGVYMTA